MPEVVSPEEIEEVKSFVISQGLHPADPNLFVWWNPAKITDFSAVGMARDIASVLKGFIFPIRINDERVVVIIKPDDLKLPGIDPERIRSLFSRLDNQCRPADQCLKGTQSTMN